MERFVYVALAILLIPAVASTTFTDREEPSDRTLFPIRQLIANKQNVFNILTRQNLTSTSQSTTTTTAVAATSTTTTEAPPTNAQTPQEETTNSVTSSSNSSSLRLQEDNDLLKQNVNNPFSSQNFIYPQPQSQSQPQMAILNNYRPIPYGFILIPIPYMPSPIQNMA